MMAKVIKLRHNFAGLAFCLDNGLSASKFDNELSLYRDTMGKKLTPDLILCNNGAVTVLDFTVTRDPRLAKTNKVLKYEPHLLDSDKLEVVLFDLQTCLWEIPEGYKNGAHCWLFKELIEETMEYWKYFTSEEYYDCAPLNVPGIPSERMEFIPIKMEFDSKDDLRKFCGTLEFREELYNCLEYIRSDWRAYVVYDSTLKRIEAKRTFPAGSTNFYSQTNLNLRKREWLELIQKDPNNIYKKILVKSIDSPNFEYSLFDSEDFPDLPGHKTISIASNPSEICTVKNFNKQAKINELIKTGIAMLKNDGMLSSKVLTPKMVKEVANDFRKAMLRKWSTAGNIRMRQLFMYPVPAVEKLLSSGKSPVSYSVPGNPSSKFLKLLQCKDIYFEYQEKVNDDLPNDSRFEEYRRARTSRNTIRGKLSWEEKKVVGKWMEEYCALRGVTKDDRKKFWCEKQCGTKGLEEYRDSCIKVLDCSFHGRFQKRARMRKNTLKLTRTESKILEDELNQIADYNKQPNETVGLFGFNGEEINFENLQKNFDLLLDYLFSDGFQINYNYINSYTFEDSDFLEKQKESTYNKYVFLAEKIGAKCLMQVAEFISRFCYSLFCMSLYNTRKGCVCFDCLGYKNAILFVAGQKSHMGKNESKPFKFLIPVNNLLNEVVGYSGTRGEILVDCDELYYASNWRFLKMEQLKYGIELPTRIQQILICTCLQYPEIPLDHSSNKFKVLLMLNNRRKNEEFLHDIKYLTYNILGILGCYRELLEDKFVLPHDHLTRYIEEKFLLGINDYVSSAEDSGLFDQKISNDYTSVKLHHPLARDSEGMDVFDCWVYSSHCMCKAAFTQKNERWKNLRGILSVHEKAREKIGPDDTEKDIFEKTNVPLSQVFDHDLNFNSDVVTMCAQQLKSYLIRTGQTCHLAKEWLKICDSDISSYANSSGLRKEGLSNPKSWGQKGHQVLLDFLHEHQSKILPKVGIFNEMEDCDPQTPKEFKRVQDKLNSTRYTVREACDDIPLRVPEFSMADKKQWGGNREIYIMTHNLKNIQWCLEQMFAAVCRVLPNELISVPSNKRMKIFYDTIKQKTTAKRYYGVFDCRKWAPLSNLAKYRLFVNGLKGVLPDSFIETFNNFWDKYYHKKLYVKGSDLEFLDFEDKQQVLTYFNLELQGEKEMGNGRTASNKAKMGFQKSKRQNSLCPDSIYSLSMNYSFMMGIFNYLSSLLHSSVQMFYMNEIVPRMNEKLDCTMKVQLWAHSDDSGGIFDLHSFTEDKSQNDSLMRKYLAVYELLQKSCNHMFSLKKCTVTYSYFEIISNIMIYGDIVPVTTKFMNSHQLNLTTQGPVSDLKSLSSQAIEMITNGSSLEAAYVKLLCLNNLYFRFLYNTKPMSFHRTIPIECGGVNDEHPGLQLMFSSSAQFCRLKRRNLDQLLSQFTELTIALGNESEDPVFPTPRFLFRYKGSREKTDYPIFSELLTTFKEVNSDCMPTNNFLFYVARMRKLNEKQALEYSMDDVRGIEIMESYVSPRNYPLCITNRGPISVKTFSNSLSPYFATCSCTKFDPMAKESIECSTMQSEGFFKIVDQYDSQIKRLNYVATMTRTKPLEFHMSNLLITNNSVYKNRNVVKFITDRRFCLMDSDYNTYENLKNSNLTEVEVKNAILLVESGKMVENFYMVCPCRLPNGINSFNEFLQFCIETNAAKEMPTIQVVYSMLVGKQFVSHGKKISANCVAKAYSRLRNIDKSSELIVGEEKAERWLIRNVGDVTEGKQAFISMGMLTEFEIMSNSNWVCYISGKQAKLDAAWWRGKTTAYAHVNGKLYVLKITNHTIEHILCSEKIQKLETIREDIEQLQGYSLSFKMKRSAKKPFSKSFGSKFGGGYVLDTRGSSIDYIQNVQPCSLELNNVTFKIRGGAMFVVESGIEYKCYFTSEVPCENCVKALKIIRNGKILPFENAINSAPRLTCNRGKGDLIMKFETTNMFKKMKEKIKEDEANWSLKPVTTHAFCQPNTLLGAIVNNNRSPDQICTNQRIMTVDFPVQTQGTRRVKIDFGKIRMATNWRGKPIVSEESKRYLLEKLDKEGMQNTCREMIKVKVERGPQYYGPFGRVSSNQTNSQIFPEFLEQMILYWGNNLEQMDPANDWLVKIFKEFTLTTYAYLSSSEKWQLKSIQVPHNPVLLILLRMRRDQGPRQGCKENYYYDPERTYLCFMQHLFNYFIWGGQEMSPSVRTRAFWKVCRSKLEDNCGVILQSEMNFIPELEIRNLDHVYNYNLMLGGAPSSFEEIEDFYQSPDGNECSVPIEECELVYNSGKLGTTVYNAYLAPDSMNEIRGVICTHEELPLELVNPKLHTYSVTTAGNKGKNSVCSILAGVHDMVVSENGEIVSSNSHNFDLTRQLFVFFGNGNPTEVTAAQAAYLFAPTSIKNILQEQVKDKPDMFKLMFEKFATQTMEEAVAELIGQDTPEEITRSSLGNEVFFNITSGNYSIGQQTIDLEVQAELEKICPKMLSIICTGRMQLTEKTRAVYEAAFGGLDWKGDPYGKIFTRLLLNECQTVKFSNRSTMVTAEILDDVFSTIDTWLKMKNKPHVEDLFDLVHGSSQDDTIEDYTYNC